MACSPSVFDMVDAGKRFALQYSLKSTVLSKFVDNFGMCNGQGIKNSSTVAALKIRQTFLTFLFFFNKN
jgi:hypothetical protein